MLLIVDLEKTIDGLRVLSQARAATLSRSEMEAVREAILCLESERNFRERMLELQGVKAHAAAN